MEIRQIEYLIGIVDHGFNLTKSAIDLNVSQPALSKFINELENFQGTKIFIRANGRITGLTLIGEELLHDARRVEVEYNTMMKDFQDSTSTKKGIVKIGIAPVIISTLFNQLIPQFIKENPKIELKIVEKGAYELQKMLILQDIDFAVLVSPPTFPAIREHIIYRNTVSVWFNKNHPFNRFKGSIPIKDINSRTNVITLDNSFMVTYQWRQLLKKFHLQPNFFFQSSSWDLLLNMCNEMDDVAAIIATPIGKNFSGTKIYHRDINPIFPWNISLCTLGGQRETNITRFTRKYFFDYFKDQAAL
ncbi:LysR family transcriptional regulator [Oenococcus sp. UCMA 16435]|nr:LysR family transcriptional regulator [Oenococcus sp. UCMA 16435]